MNTIPTHAFVEQDGMCCPGCSCPDVFVFRNIDAGTHNYRQMKCQSCGSTWDEVYALVGYEHFVPGNIPTGVLGYTLMPSGFKRWKCPACHEENFGSNKGWNLCNQCEKFFHVENYDRELWSICLGDNDPYSL